MIHEQDSSFAVISTMITLLGWDTFCHQQQWYIYIPNYQAPTYLLKVRNQNSLTWCLGCFVIVIVDLRGNVRSQVHYIWTGEELHRTVSHLPRPISGQIKLYWDWWQIYWVALPGIVANNTTFCYSYKYDKICCKSYWSIQFISSSNAVYKCRKMHYNSTLNQKFLNLLFLWMWWLMNSVTYHLFA